MDVKFSPSARRLLCKRYLLPKNEGTQCELCGQLHEAPEEMLQRVSLGNQQYYDLMASLDFLPGSPTLFNMGNIGTLSACFKFDVQDTLESIMNVGYKAAFVQKWGGGVGYCLSALREKGAPIRSTHGSACGPVATLRLYHAIALMITQGGKREGAQMAILHCEHPDVREFIHCKDEDPEAFGTFNLSVACTENFMRKVTSGVLTEEGALLRAMAESAWRTGDPGVYFIDTAERANPTPRLGKLTGTNPCGEVPLLDNEPCNLGSINLSNFVKVEPNYEDHVARCFDFDRLKLVVPIAVRFLDDVIEQNWFPDPEITEAALYTRKIGLGVMGWADALALMHISYDSQHAEELAKQIMSCIQEVSHVESVKLGVEKGMCPAEPLLGRRNATVTCVAPTGSISVLAGCSSGIEPHYALDSEIIMGDGEPLSGRTVTLDRLKGFTPKTAHEIDYEWHIIHQAAFQEYTDLAVSKTINMPNTVTVQNVLDAFVQAWRTGCKGVTIFREGCRERQAVRAKALESVVEPIRIPRKRVRVTSGTTERVQTGCGYIYVTVNRDEQGICEVFAALGKAGGCAAAELEAVSRLISLCLRSGLGVQSIAKHLRSIRCPSAAWDEGRAVLSCPDAISGVLERAAGISVSTDSGMFCPDCGSSVIMQEGCLQCSASCGWNRC